MDEATKATIRAWLAAYHGDEHALAFWMRDSLQFGGLAACREMIRAAVEPSQARAA